MRFRPELEAHLVSGLHRRCESLPRFRELLVRFGFRWSSGLVVVHRRAKTPVKEREEKRERGRGMGLFLVNFSPGKGSKRKGLWWLFLGLSNEAEIYSSGGVGWYRGFFGGETVVVGVCFVGFFMEEKGGVVAVWLERG